MGRRKKNTVTTPDVDIVKKEAPDVETKIIVSSEYYIEFINSFINNINDIKVIPKIAIFTKQKELFINSNKQYPKKQN